MEYIRRTYADIVIRMRDFDGGWFAVEVTRSPVGRMRVPDIVPFDEGVIPVLQKLDEQDERPESSPTLNEIRELGEMLSAMLFPQTVREIFRKSAVAVKREVERVHREADSGGMASKVLDVPALRIVLNIDAQRLTTLPWEYAYLWEHVNIRSQPYPSEESLTKELRTTDHPEELRVLTKQYRRQRELDGFILRDPSISMIRSRFGSRAESGGRAAGDPEGLGIGCPASQAGFEQASGSRTRLDDQTRHIRAR